jgi:hypothetical protein
MRVNVANGKANKKLASFLVTVSNHVRKKHNLQVNNINSRKKVSTNQQIQLETDLNVIGNKDADSRETAQFM